MEISEEKFFFSSLLTLRVIRLARNSKINFSRYFCIFRHFFEMGCQKSSRSYVCAQTIMNYARENFSDLTLSLSAFHSHELQS
jgi:hypothetical protein